MYLQKISKIFLESFYDHDKVTSEGTNTKNVYTCPITLTRACLLLYIWELDICCLETGLAIPQTILELDITKLQRPNEDQIKVQEILLWLSHSASNISLGR